MKYVDYSNDIDLSDIVLTSVEFGTRTLQEFIHLNTDGNSQGMTVNQLKALIDLKVDESLDIELVVKRVK